MLRAVIMILGAALLLIALEVAEPFMENGFVFFSLVALYAVWIVFIFTKPKPKTRQRLFEDHDGTLVREPVEEESP